MLKISALCLDKQKSYIPKKIEVYHVQWVTLISAKRWRLDVLTFLTHGFEDYLTNFMSCSILRKIQEQGGKKSIYGYLIGHITLFLPQYGSCNIKTVPYILLSINQIQVVKRQFYQGRFCILPNPSENSD